MENPGFPKRGVSTQRWGTKLLFWPIFPENCMKMKKLDREAAYISDFPLDPPKLSKLCIRASPKRELFCCFAWTGHSSIHHIYSDLPTLYTFAELNWTKVNVLLVRLILLQLFWFTWRCFAIVEWYTFKIQMIYSRLILNFW